MIQITLHTNRSLTPERKRAIEAFLERELRPRRIDWEYDRPRKEDDHEEG